MLERLIFDEARHRPTRDKKSYEPYPVKTITVVNQNTLFITCQNESAANHCAQCVASILTARHVSMNDEFEFKRGEIDIKGNQFHRA